MKRRQILIVGLVVLMFFIGVIVGFKNQEARPQESPDLTAEPVDNSTEKEPDLAWLPEAEIDQIVQNWAAGSGDRSVMVMDEQGKVIAEASADQPMFAASIYKLYVAYVGYMAAEEDGLDLDEDYIQGLTRRQCLWSMVTDSNNPCAEYMWGELGSEHIEQVLRGFGLNQTRMSTSLTTTARDAALILERLIDRPDFNDDLQSQFWGSLKDQIYRNALQSGFSRAKAVYNKVGFRDNDEYHDVGVVDFGHDRRLIVSVMTRRVGAAQIASLARNIEAAILD